MRFSVFLAFAIVAAFVFLFVKATCGEYSVIVFGLLGIWAVLAFFKHVVNAT